MAATVRRACSDPSLEARRRRRWSTPARPPPDSTEAPPLAKRVGCERESTRSLFENFGRGELSFDKIQDSLGSLRLRDREDRLAAVCRIAKGAGVASKAARRRSLPCCSEAHGLHPPTGPEDTELQRAFARYDRDGDGFLSPGDLPALFADLGFGLGDGCESDPAATRRQAFVAKAFASADANGDGRVSFEEFAEYHGRFASMLEALRSSSLPDNFKRCATFPASAGRGAACGTSSSPPTIGAIALRSPLRSPPRQSLGGA